MKSSYFPKSDSQLVIWATNYKNKISNHTANLEMTNEQVVNETAYCNALIEAINNVSSAKQALKAATDAKLLAIETQGGALRNEIARHKLTPNFTDAIGQDLGIIGVALDFNPASYKAKISAEIFAGLARIKFTKKGVDGINIYHRKKGTTPWLFMARVTKSPFDDHITLENPNQPEHWEYRAYGVMDDLEIGIPSDIVELIIGN